MSGIPVRLSAELAAGAREAAAKMDRSLTEQVEHWARLGQMIERLVLGSTIERLKTLSHDHRILELLAEGETKAGRARTARLIRRRNPVRWGIDARGRIVKRTGR